MNFPLVPWLQLSEQIFAWDQYSWQSHPYMLVFKYGLNFAQPKAEILKNICDE
jgi:hypothetical protein